MDVDDGEDPRDPEVEVPPVGLPGEDGPSSRSSHSYRRSGEIRGSGDWDPGTCGPV